MKNSFNFSTRIFFSLIILMRMTKIRIMVDYQIVFVLNSKVCIVFFNVSCSIFYTYSLIYLLLICAYSFAYVFYCKNNSTSDQTWKFVFIMTNKDLFNISYLLFLYFIYFILFIYQNIKIHNISFFLYFFQFF